MEMSAIIYHLKIVKTSTDLRENLITTRGLRLEIQARRVGNPLQSV